MDNKIKIGLEIHVQLNTVTKLFCGCPTQGEDTPNTRTCPICLGHPGSRPVLNKAAVDFALKMCLATDCKISKELIFSRKSYFYPDMSKNYQITQYEIPLGEKGKITLNNKTINLTRIHMEEDPAALVHQGDMATSPFVLVDYNRSGNPLIEIVTEPDMNSAKEARAFMNKLITILEYLEIFDINTCIIKADVNVSIQPHKRVEIKNVTGFKEIQKAIEYELKRQEDPATHEENIHTRNWDSDQAISSKLREKESEEEYGYIIDPDLTITDITADMIKKTKEHMPELAESKIAKFQEKLNIAEDDAKIIATDKSMAELLERVAKVIDPVLAGKWIRRELNRVLNYNKKSLKEISLDEPNFIKLLKLIEKKTITDSTAQKLLEIFITKPFDPEVYVKEQGLEAVSDSSQIEEFAEEAVKENPEAVQDYKSGNEKALHFIVGQVMRKSKGQATPAEVNDILKKLLT